jgi:hypothetical protein
MLLNIKCVFWFFLQLLSEAFLILRRVHRDIINVHRTVCKVSVVRVGFYWNVNFLDSFGKTRRSCCCCCCCCVCVCVCGFFFLFFPRMRLMLCVKSSLFVLRSTQNTNIQFVPRSKHPVSVIQTSQLMLCREIIDVCSEIHTKHINTLCGQNVELWNIQPGGT